MTELIHASSLYFNSPILPADAYMITSLANILRTHPSKVKLEMSLLYWKHNIGPNTEPCSTPFLYLDIHVVVAETKQVVGGCEDNFLTR